ncbi:Glutathione-specific gamma-glutamylcyclotransferase [Fusarium oxysporum f. sp. albedinis]|nr:Glutathione-specific gamma-glutamylcyclotransferase [Fusarium oxysporum f. sp. albedinis]
MSIETISIYVFKVPCNRRSNPLTVEKTKAVTMPCSTFRLSKAEDLPAPKTHGIKQEQGGSCCFFCLSSKASRSFYGLRRHHITVQGSSWIRLRRHKGLKQEKTVMSLKPLTQSRTS